MLRHLMIFWLLAGMALPAFATTKAVMRVTALASDAPPGFQQFGTGLQRFEDDTLALAQGVIAIDSQLAGDWRFHSVLNAYSDGEQQAGFSQAYVEYRPLTASSIKPSLKLGAFYPQLSVENTDTGWLSPHFLSNSAINSWLGEELRIGGAEVSFRRPGRQVRSPLSWKVSAGVYKGNDTTGTLLSWRGFSLHDRQSLYNDRVNFARWPTSLRGFRATVPAWTDPFTEIDGKWGWYAGAQLSYKRKTEARYFFYDNRANPNAINRDRLYGWRTRFHSLAVRHMLSSSTQLYGQLLTGDTLMGSRVVDNDFHAAYLALSHELADTHRISARGDWFQVIDRDDYYGDPNASQGVGITINYTWHYSPHVALSVEWQRTVSSADYRPLLGHSRTQGENLLQIALTLKK